jgi:hypothetical protein
MASRTARNTAWLSITGLRNPGLMSVITVIVSPPVPP